MLLQIFLGLSSQFILSHPLPELLIQQFNQFFFILRSLKLLFNFLNPLQLLLPFFLLNKLVARRHIPGCLIAPVLELIRL
jgi:hypothetical protein